MSGATYLKRASRNSLPCSSSLRGPTSGDASPACPNASLASSARATSLTSLRPRFLGPLSRGEDGEPHLLDLASGYSDRSSSHFTIFIVAIAVSMRRWAVRPGRPGARRPIQSRLTM